MGLEYLKVPEIRPEYLVKPGYYVRFNDVFYKIIIAETPIGFHVVKKLSELKTATYSIASGAEEDIGDMSDLLEPSRNVIYFVFMGIKGQCQVYLEQPSGEKRFSIRHSVTNPIDSTLSPFYQPNKDLFIICFGDSYPAIILKNPTEYTQYEDSIALRFLGPKYEVKKVEATDILDKLAKKEIPYADWTGSVKRIKEAGT